MMLKPKYVQLGVFALIVYLIVIAVAGGGIVRQNNGLFIHALDDPYIHLAIAKNWIEKGIWSANGVGFTSASSSPLWTLLLAGGFALFGVHDLAAFVLAILSGIFLIFVVIWVAQIHRASLLMTATSVVSVSLLTPLVFLTLSGMEHVLHAALTILFAFVFARSFDRIDLGIKEMLPIFILGALVVSARMEGMFLVASAAGMLLIRRRFSHAALLMAAGGLSIAIIGGIGMYHGWYILPNSILIKTVVNGDGGVIANLAGMFRNPFMFRQGGMVLLILALLNLLCLKKVNSAVKDTANLVIVTRLFLAISVAHILFARIGYRYEAYLVAFGVVIFCIFLVSAPIRVYLKASEERLPRGVVLILFAALCLALISPRALSGLAFGKYGAKNIYDQQYQMARFFGNYYSNETIGLNDIGAVGYFTDVKIVDLWGLADLEVGRLRIEGTYTVESLARIAHERQVAAIAIYEDWFSREDASYRWSAATGMPRSWVKVGTWTIQNNVVAGSQTVTFFARDVETATVLQNNLTEFSNTLPEGVVYEGYDWVEG